MSSSNNLYGQLIELAHQQELSISQLSSQRQSKHHEQSNEFTKQLKDIKQTIIVIRDNNQRILSYKNQLMTNALIQKQQQLYESIRLLCDQNYQLISELKLLLEQIDRSVQLDQKNAPNEPQTYSKRYHKQYLQREIEQIMRDCQTINSIIQKYSINTTLKRIKALAPQLSAQQAKQIANKKDGFDQIVMSKLMGKSTLRLKYRIKDIFDKHQEILYLQQSVQSNMKLMKEIAQMVQEQGQQIDNVWTNVKEAQNYVQKAQVNLKKQKKKHKMSKKRICCILLVGLIILSLIIVPIIITVVKKNQAS